MAMQSRRLVVRRRQKENTGAGIRATVMSVQRAETDTSRQIEAVDEFAGFVVSNNGSMLLPVPYNVSRLFELIERSNMVGQCIESYVTNIVLTGWEPDNLYRERKASQDEVFELQSFIDHANVDQSLTMVLEEAIRDRESVGFGFLEVVRDLLGRPSLIRHASAKHTRICTKHKDEVFVRYEIMRGRRVTAVQEFKKFRKYVQIINGQTRWFKEFGDPRPMNAETGYYANEEGYRAGFDATEIIHLRLPSSEPYGVPRWINQLPSIIGSREAEEVNMRYFQDNTVPPMMLLVGNGRLTQASYQELTRVLNSDGIGQQRQHKVLLLEAIGETDSLDGKTNNIDLKVEKLTDARQSDGLFKDYDSANMAKVRSSFRLPPVLVGMSQDVNFATATTSVFVAESQVFAPERSRLDEILNRTLINGVYGLGLKTAKLTSRTPSITAPELVIKTLTALNVMGAVTPRSAQSVANKMLQLEIGAYPEDGQEGYEEWMDQPMPLTLRGTVENTQNEQANKTDQIKDTEVEGDVLPSRPKNGEQ